jgi:hypothetical protein
MRKAKTLPVGTRVKTDMGCQISGVVIPWIPLDKCTDGSYRGPETDRERKCWVSVRWDDGTQGYSHAVYLVVE